MVPLYGFEVYDRLIHSNGWARAYLPNAFDQNASGHPVEIIWPRASRIKRGLKQGAERVLQGKLGNLWERRESSAKIHQLSIEAACFGASTAAFTLQRCKGHMDDHGNHIQRAYTQRLECLGIDPQEAWPHLSVEASALPLTRDRSDH